MNDFYDIMYDLIIESLTDHVENGEMTITEADIISEAAYTELIESKLSDYVHGSIQKNLQDFKWPSEIEQMDSKTAKIIERVKHCVHMKVFIPIEMKKMVKSYSDEDLDDLLKYYKKAQRVLEIVEKIYLKFGGKNAPQDIQEVKDGIMGDADTKEMLDIIKLHYKFITQEKLRRIKSAKINKISDNNK